MAVNVTVSIKDTEAFVDLLEASSEFFAWYNKTYQNQPSNHPDHAWCKLGLVLQSLTDTESKTSGKISD
jgi:hypothetical protein